MEFLVELSISLDLYQIIFSGYCTRYVFINVGMTQGSILLFVIDLSNEIGLFWL